MAQQGPHLDLHEAEQRQTRENLVQLGIVPNVEDAEIRVFPDNPPDMAPLPLRCSSCA